MSPKSKSKSKSKATKKATPKKKGRPRGRSANRDELPQYNEDLLDFVSHLIALRWSPFQIRAAVPDWCSEFAPGLDPTTAQMNECMTKARERLAYVERPDLEALRNQAIQTYEAILRDPGTPPRDKIKAQERIDAIFGHDAKYRGNSPGTPQDRAAKIREALAAMDVSSDSDDDAVPT